jgi:hypothetical protein
MERTDYGIGRILQCIIFSGAGVGGVRRLFFSEEKNQKTFNSALVDSIGTWPERGRCGK